MAATKEDLDALKEEVKRLKSHKMKLPAKAPGVYKKAEGDFSAYSDILLNYFRLLNVPPEERSKLLMTYLSPEDHEAVVQVYPAEKLGAEPFETAVERISHVLSENITRATACSKLMKQKQGNLTMSDYLKRLEHYGKIAFPEAKMKEAKLRVMTSSLQANCRSKILAYEIHNFIKTNTTETTEPDFSEISLKALELDQILGHKDNDSDGELEAKSPTASIFNVKNPAGNSREETRKCFKCGIKGHLQATCRRKGMGSNYKFNKGNFSGGKQINNNNRYNYRNNSGFRQNKQNRKPNSYPGSNEKVQFLDTTELKELDLNSKSLQREKVSHDLSL